MHQNSKQTQSVQSLSSQFSQHSTTKSTTTPLSTSGPPKSLKTHSEHFAKDSQLTSSFHNASSSRRQAVASTFHHPATGIQTLMVWLQLDGKTNQCTALSPSMASQFSKFNFLLECHIFLHQI